MVAGLLVTSHALAGARLLPEADRLEADAARIDRQLTSMQQGTGLSVSLGVTSLVTAAVSVTAGMALVGAGQMQFFLPLVVLAPTISTLLGTVLIILGAVDSRGPPVEQVLALAHERDELRVRRAALLRAREAASEAPAACDDTANAPATPGG